MSVVDRSGALVEGAKRQHPLLDATDEELRGYYANFLISLGMKPKRVKKVVRVSRAHLYRNINAAKERLAEATREDAA